MPPIYQDVSTRNNTSHLLFLARSKELGHWEKESRCSLSQNGPLPTRHVEKKWDETKHVTLFVEESKGIQTFQGAMLKQFVSLDSIPDL